MNPDDDTKPDQPEANSSQPHLGHGGLTINPLHTADQIAAEQAADEPKPDQDGQSSGQPAFGSATVAANDQTDQPATNNSAAPNPAASASSNDAPVKPSAETEANPTAPPEAPDTPIAPVVIGGSGNYSNATKPSQDEAKGANFSPDQPKAATDNDGAKTPSSAPSAPDKPKKKRGKLLKFLLPAVIIIILAAAGTGGYMYVKSVQPKQRLESALNNSLQQKQFHTTGKLSIDPTSSKSSSPAYKMTFNGQTNLSSKATDVQINLTVDGLTFPAEARLVNQNLYFKLGDLSDINSLIKNLAPSEAPLAKSLSGQLSNQWIEVDSTLLKQFGASCALDTNLNLSPADINYLDKDLKNHNFITIKNRAGTKLNGKSAEEYTLALNDNKGAKFFSNLNQLSAIKALQTCEGEKSNLPLNTKFLADNDTTPLNLWVDKSTNRIVKLTTQTTAKDEQKDHETATVTMNLSYGPVNVAAPKNAEPAVQLLTKIESSLLGASGISSLPNLNPSTSAGSSLFTQNL
ncbi:MAG: hypothetical protein ACREGA_05210 [Candidatus Saccharimonadales bacterium]